MKRKRLISLFVILFGIVQLSTLNFQLSTLKADDNMGAIWMEAGATKALPYNLSVDLGVGYRTIDWFDDSYRSDVGVGLNWKASKHWKLGAGYTLLMKKSPSETSYKYETETEYKYVNPTDATDEVELTEFQGRNYPSDATPTYKYDGYNIKTKNDTRVDESFWRQKHRVYVDATYTTKFCKFLRITIKERYQMTYVPKTTISRTRYREKTVIKYRDPSYDGEGNLCSETYADGESWENGDWPLTYPYEDIARYWQEGDVIYKDHVNYDDEDKENKVDATAEYLAAHEPLNTITIIPHEKRSKTIHTLRSRVKLSIDKKGWKWEPYIFAETHNNLGDGMHLDKIRASIGVDYAIKKGHKIGLGYIFNHENDDDGNQNIHAISVGYNFKF